MVHCRSAVREKWRGIGLLGTKRSGCAKSNVGQNPKTEMAPKVKANLSLKKGSVVILERSPSANFKTNERHRQKGLDLTEEKKGAAGPRD